MDVSKLPLWGCQVDGADAEALAEKLAPAVRRRTCGVAIRARQRKLACDYRTLKQSALRAPLFASTKSAAVAYQIVCLGTPFQNAIELRMSTLAPRMPGASPRDLAQRAVEDLYEIAKAIAALGKADALDILEKRLAFESAFRFSWTAKYTALQFTPNSGCGQYGRVTMVIAPPANARMTVFAGDSALAVLDSELGSFKAAIAASEPGPTLRESEDRFAAYPLRACAAVAHNFDSIVASGSPVRTSLHLLHEPPSLIEVHIHTPISSANVHRLHFDQAYIRDRNREFVNLRYFPGDNRIPLEIATLKSSIKHGFRELFYFSELISHAYENGGQYISTEGTICLT